MRRLLVSTSILFISVIGILQLSAQTSSGTVYVDNSIANGATEGTIIDSSNWPEVIVGVSNEHKYWTKIAVLHNINDVIVEPINVWSQFGYIPGESEARYKLVFNDEYDFSSIQFFVNAARSEDGRPSASVITFIQRTIDTITNAAGGTDFESAGIDSLMYVLEQIPNLPDCVNAGDSLTIGNYFQFFSDFRKCLTEDQQASVIVSIASRFGANVTTDWLENVLFTPLKLTELILEVWDSLWSIIKGTFAGSVMFYSEVDPNAPPPPIVTPPPVPIPTVPPGADHATFVTDITIPDGTVVTSDESMIKTWRMRNAGSTTWGNGYKLAFVGGEQMGAPGEVNVPAAAPVQEVDISINLTAPTSEGEHIGYWQLRNPQGTYFGPQIFVDIVVQNGAPPPSSTGYSLKCTNCPATVEPGTTFRPVVQATIGSGQLLESRGDILRHKSGDLFGAWPHIAVVGAQNERYDFVFYADNPITAPTTNGTYQTTWQLWQNGQYVGPELEIRFEVQSGGGTNHPPNAPSLTDPGDWAVFDGTIPTLQAQHSGDPDDDSVTAYYFEIFESHDIPNSGWISSNSWTPPNLDYYGYQWRVKVRDSRGAESDWSEVRHFNIKNPTPAIYDFHWEWCRDAWGGSEKVCFCAQTSGGGLNLKLNSANDGSDSGEWKSIGDADTNINCNTDDDRPVNWGQLEAPAGSYRVRLYQRPNVGGWDDSNTADVVVTLPPNQRPGPPEILLPKFSSYQNSTNVHIEWKQTYRTDDYHLLISAEPDFTPLLVDQHIPVGTTTFDYAFQQEYETVYVKVIATGPYGIHEYPSSFHIDTSPPSSSVISLPQISYETAFSVNWAGSDARSGLRWYHVQVRDGDRPDSNWEDWLVNTTKTAEIFRGQPGHTYYFRVRAMDEIGNWEEWPTSADGDTYTIIDPASAPQTAWWNNNYAQKRNLITLNNDTDTIPTNFPMHIHFDSSTTPTAAEIYNASLTAVKGNDVRIVYDNQLELDRFVQRFTASQIDIWFPLQVALGGGQTDNSSYQIYYGYAGSVSPPADINNVFLPKTDANTMALWHFQEGNGSTINDSSGHNHNGVFYNANWADGFLGRAGSFNGSNAYVQVPHTNDLNLNAFTLEAWIYLNGYLGAHPAIISKDYYWFSVDNDRKLWFGINADGGNRILVNNTPLNMNQWYHVAATYDGNGHMKIYVNGQENGHRDESPLTLLYTNLPFRIGRMSHIDPNVGQYIPGYIQNVRVSNIARTTFSYGRIDISPSTAAGVEQTPPIIGNPDLVILNLIAYPNMSGGQLVQAVVQNQGDIPTVNGFFTDLYADHIPTGEGDYTNSLRFWINDPIEAGATITLTTVLDNASSNLAQITTALTDENTFMLYAQTDSAGSIGEPNETNNIYTDGIQTCIASPDAFENDETYSAASLVTLGDTQTHNFDHLGDEDWIRFEAQGGTTYALQTSELDTSADTYIYLHDTDGTTLLASNDDYAGSLASHMEWTAPATGTYYILVRHWNPNVGGCKTSYNFRLAEPGFINQLFLPIALNNFSPPQPLLELSFENSFSGADGEIGTANGITFATGYSGNGILVDANDSLYYATNNNIDREAGSIEFWLKPSWNGNDSESYVFVEVGNTWFNRMRVMKDGANNFRFMVWSTDTEYDASYNVSSWNADEWHHVRVSWQDGSIRLYLDGILRDTETDVVLPDYLTPLIYIGSTPHIELQSQAIIDELVIYSQP